MPAAASISRSASAATAFAAAAARVAVRRARRRGCRSGRRAESGGGKDSRGKVAVRLSQRTGRPSAARDVRSSSSGGGEGPSRGTARVLEIAPVGVDGPRRTPRREHSKKPSSSGSGDGPGRSTWRSPSRRHGCRPAWSRARSARGAPGSCGGLRRPRGGGSRTRGGAVRVRADPAERARVEPAAARGQEDAVLAPANESRARFAEVPGDPVGGLLAERHHASLPPLPWTWRNSWSKSTSARSRSYGFALRSPAE